MGLKPYQPHRKEFLINTDWGTAKDVISREEAKGRGLVLFKGRWVTKEDRALLKDEYHAYHSIRIIAKILIYFSVPIMFFSVPSTVSYGKRASFIAGAVIFAASLISAA